MYYVCTNMIIPAYKHMSVGTTYVKKMKKIKDEAAAAEGKKKVSFLLPTRRARITSAKFSICTYVDVLVL